MEIEKWLKEMLENEKKKDPNFCYARSWGTLVGVLQNMEMNYPELKILPYLKNCYYK